MTTDGTRIGSMDQFRGYTVAGMFLVNFLGVFAVTHPLLKHHNTYCSYADTIMPQFFFAVGLSLRLALLKRIEREGWRSAYARAVRRGFSLALVGLVIYHLDGHYESWAELQALGISGFFRESFWTSPFQALVHIAVTTLWILPVTARSARVRIAFAVASALLHLGLSRWFWYDLLHEKNVIDGGLLGFLSWTIPTIAGTLAYDLLVGRGAARSVRPLVLHGTWLMLLGYGLACLTAGGVVAAPPFVPPWHPSDLWTMSQQAGSVSYMTFSAGLSLVVLALFVWWTDLRGHRSVVFDTLGKNALAAYILHILVQSAFAGFLPADAPLWWALVAFGLFFYMSYRFTRYMNDRGMFLRL
jgi:predicted acyltransferase